MSGTAGTGANAENAIGIGKPTRTMTHDEFFNWAWVFVLLAVIVLCSVVMSVAPGDIRNLPFFLLYSF